MKLDFKFRDSDLSSPAKVDHNIYDPNLDSAESLEIRKHFPFPLFGVAPFFVERWLVRH
jgi:hypothetical protein